MIYLASYYLQNYAIILVSPLILGGVVDKHIGLLEYTFRNNYNFTVAIYGYGHTLMSVFLEGV